MREYPLLPTEYSNRHGDSSLSSIVMRTFCCIACKHLMMTSILKGVSSVMVGMLLQAPFGNVVSMASNSSLNCFCNSCESSQFARTSLIRSFRNIRSASEIMTSGKLEKIDSTWSVSLIGDNTNEWANSCS